LKLTLPKNYDIIIIGGGLAGLSNAIHLAKSGLQVALIEKNEFPKHKVCGEYISNEVLPYLNWLGIDPFAHGATKINRFEISTPAGKMATTKLPLGGFGISRYLLDHLMVQKANLEGCEIIQDTAEQLRFDDDQFFLQTKKGTNYRARFIIGAFGKRSKLDKTLNRAFFQKRAPYLGVKAHYRGEFKNDLVALHNFNGGYCGVSKVEDDLINICYLVDFQSFKKHNDLETFQENVLMKNPHLRSIMRRSKMEFEKPLTISQISFLQKDCVEDHLLMSGDSAGMIHPLCGNGMGMAIHSALILSELLIKYFSQKSMTRQNVEDQYRKAWQNTFRKRLNYGKIFNELFSKRYIFEKGLSLVSHFPSVLNTLIRNTHGNVLVAPDAKPVTI